MKTVKDHTEISKQLLYPLEVHCNNSISEEIIRKEQHLHQKNLGTKKLNANIMEFNPRGTTRR